MAISNKEKPKHLSIDEILNRLSYIIKHKNVHNKRVSLRIDELIAQLRIRYKYLWRKE